MNLMLIIYYKKMVLYKKLLLYYIMIIFKLLKVKKLLTHIFWNFKQVIQLLLLYHNNS